jgi:pantoate--beta-alanine ligase
MSELTVVRSVGELRAAIAAWRAAGQTIGLVPTMGALHDAHMTLMRTARTRADRVVATIFVNPTQFGPNEDLSAYPRREAQDIETLRADGIDLLFAPDVAEMYPDGFATTVTVAGVSEGLCGEFRPGHFAGVATIVTKLLLQSLPDIAFFGEKDYQQLQVIRRLARDLDIPVEIAGLPTVREADGLAMSSRNQRLDPARRAIAPRLHEVLQMVAAQVASGTPVVQACAAGRSELEAAGFDPVEYLEVRDSDSLQPPGTHPDPKRSYRVLAAAWLGDVRLIDNIAAN